MVPALIFCGLALAMVVWALIRRHEDQERIKRDAERAFWTEQVGRIVTEMANVRRAIADAARAGLFDRESR
ncbi:MAG: hypothetical protein LUO93_11165 [Methanomicrobiales archaeon]|nr:hypothetical protein [Methanomicrobiales archaeon]